MSNFVMQPNPASPSSHKVPWWREPYVWLVIGGPLVVVVAGLATAYIAMKAPDPVIDRSAIQREALTKAQSDGQITPGELAKLQPAQQGRNHAAAPVVPKPNPD